jgi:hypothetical protein
MNSSCSNCGSSKRQRYEFDTPIPDVGSDLCIDCRCARESLSPAAKRVLQLSNDNIDHRHCTGLSGVKGDTISLPGKYESSQQGQITLSEEQKHDQLSTSQSTTHQYQVRSLTSSYRDNRRTNDDIHSSISLGPVVTCLLDTPPMQRLRGLKQLGCAEYVYINCNHTRFEHSLGVSSLAETLCRKISIKQPSLQCSEKDILCVQLAGTFFLYRIFCSVRGDMFTLVEPWF